MDTTNKAKPESGLELVKHFLTSGGIKQKFDELLGGRASQFITSVMQIVSANKDLQNADLQSIYNAAATAAVLDLPLNNNLQFAHLIPYKDGKTGIIYCQFQAGWRAYVQLAQRSGQFKTINVTDVREGELKSRDRLTNDCVFEWNQDDEKRNALPIIGFVSYFRLINGFEKPLYRTIAELKAHAQKYSKTYNRADGKWNTDFEAMCSKTVIKENLSKWAPLSIEMARVIQADQSVVGDIDEGKFEYPDNPNEDQLSDEEAAKIAEDAKKKQAEELANELNAKIKKDEKKP